MVATQYNSTQESRSETISKELFKNIRQQMNKHIINTKVEDLDERLKELEEPSIVPLVTSGLTTIVGLTGIGLCATADGPGQFIAGGVMGVIGGKTTHSCIQDFRYRFSKEYKTELSKTQKSYNFWISQQKLYNTKN